MPFSIFDWHDRTGNRRVLVQRQVSPRFLVVRTVPRHQLPSAGFAEHDHVVETFATRGSHKSLDEWILPGCVWGGEPFLNSHRLRGGRKRVERVVAIMDQIPRRLVPRKRFAHLLGRPRRRRMRGDRHVSDAAPIVGEQHQHEHEAERHRRDHEEIGGDDLADVIAQERAPRLRGRLASTAHVFRAGRLTHVDAELQQFAEHPRRAPARVRLGHVANQGADVGGHSRSPETTPTFPGPPHAETASVHATTVSGLTRRVPSAIGSRGARAGPRASGPPSRAAPAGGGCAAALPAGAARPGFRVGGRRANVSASAVKRSECSTEIKAEKRIHRRP